MKFTKHELNGNNKMLSWANRRARKRFELAFVRCTMIDRDDYKQRVNEARRWVDGLFDLLSARIDVPKSVLVHGFVTDSPKIMYASVCRHRERQARANDDIANFEVPTFQDFMSVLSNGFTEVMVLGLRED